MDKRMRVGYIILVLLLLVGCDNNIENQAMLIDEVNNEIEVIHKVEISDQTIPIEPIQNEAIQYRYTDIIDETVVPLEGEFYDRIDSNPIDEAFVWEDDGVENRIMRASQYYDAWIDEIDKSLIVLKEYLKEEDFEMLSSSYEGWKQYSENILQVERSIFYPGSDYLGMGYPLAGGSLTHPNVMEITAMRARNYAIELKSLEYIFTEEVEFVYQKE